MLLIRVSNFFGFSAFREMKKLWKFWGFTGIPKFWRYPGNLENLRDLMKS